MRRTYLFTVLALILGVLIFVYGQSPRRGAQIPQTVPKAQRISIEKEVGTQQRINRYFHGDVMSKLKKCWSNVRGKGQIGLRYTYTKSAAKWIFSRLDPEHSSLPSGQDAIALRCMLDAVRGSGFPVEATESTQSTFVLNWTWPVPFPANASQLTTAMFAARPGQTATGGCDGWGTPAKCYTCGAETCDKVCVGYSKCTVFSNDSCIASDNCASGGPFGVSGTLVIF